MWWTGGGTDPPPPVHSPLVQRPTVQLVDGALTLCFLQQPLGGTRATRGKAPTHAPKQRPKGWKHREKRAHSTTYLYTDSWFCELLDWCCINQLLQFCLTFWKIVVPRNISVAGLNNLKFCIDQFCFKIPWHREKRNPGCRNISWSYRVGSTATKRASIRVQHLRRL